MVCARKCAESDGAVEKYRAEAGLLKGKSSTLGAQEISELNTQITLAEAARSEAEAKADEIRELLESQGSVEASSEVLASSTIQRLREQQVTSEQKYNELSATYLPNHPKMLAAKKDINDIERRIRREALKVVDGLQGQAKIAQARANSLRKSLEALKSREGSAILDEVRLKELEREAKANRDQLEVMLSRFADSNTRQNLELQPGFARVIQTATAPASPYFPRIGPILLLASLAGLAFGVGLAFLLEIMAQAARMNEVAMAGGEQPANRVRHPAREAMQQRIEIPKLDVTQSRSEQGAAKGSIRSGGNVAPAAVYLPTTLASVPQARSGLEASSLLAALSAGGAMQNSVTQLSQHLQTMHNNGSLKGCAIANLGGAHEVPTMALALGRHLADSGLKTILVDLEAQHSILPDLMALADAPGLTELLTGTSDFSRAIQRDGSVSCSSFATAALRFQLKRNCSSAWKPSQRP